ncbi:MAG: type II toxin-antitoxin system prevent-host-death family antitoxin [Chitinophagaceae bacterium]|nr:type II toxin-antitoxin system prevent-host-death family antitoxin [Rubrivivax sp.]
MRTAGVFEAKQNFSELIAAVEAGEEVRITRHGKEVVRMLPVPTDMSTDKNWVERELQALRELRARVKPGPGWRELRDEGRRS